MKSWRSFHSNHSYHGTPKHAEGKADFAYLLYLYWQRCNHLSSWQPRQMARDALGREALTTTKFE